MASLSIELQNRFGTQYVISITNPQLSSATTIDTIRLNSAIADCVVYFAVYAGEIVDSAAPTANQIAMAVPTIIEILKVYTGQLSWHTVEPSVKARLEAYAEISSRDRMKMTTDSAKKKTDDVNDELVFFDRNQFKGYTPAPPSSNQQGSGTQD